MINPIDIDALRQLMERLRDGEHMTQRDGLGAMLMTAHGAADAIEAMATELEALRASRGRMVEALERITRAFPGHSSFMIARLQGYASDALLPVIPVLQDHYCVVCNGSRTAYEDMGDGDIAEIECPSCIKREDQAALQPAEDCGGRS